MSPSGLPSPSISPEGNVSTSVVFRFPRKRALRAAIARSSRNAIETSDGIPGAAPARRIALKLLFTNASISRRGRRGIARPLMSTLMSAELDDLVAHQPVEDQQSVDLAHRAYLHDRAQVPLGVDARENE